MSAENEALKKRVQGDRMRLEKTLQDKEAEVARLFSERMEQLQGDIEHERA